jgi:hypothetical protein
MSARHRRRSGPGLSARRPLLPRLALLLLLGGLALSGMSVAAASDLATAADTPCPVWQGVVVDPDGVGIRGATVAAGERAVESDPRGRFALAGVGGSEEIRIDALGYAPWRAAVPCAERAELARILLEPAELLRGRLLREDGSPVTRAMLHLEWAPERGRVATRNLEIDAPDGLFRVVLPEAARYRASVSADGLQRIDLGEWVVAPRTEVDTGVTLMDPGAVVTASFVDAETGAPATGTVLQASLFGLAGAAADLRREVHRESADADGAVSVAGLSPGRYALAYRGPLGERGLRLLTLRRNERVDLGELRVGTGSELLGRVLGPDGSPVAGATIRLFDPAAELFDPFAEATTDPEGRFRITALAPGEYLVRVLAPSLLHSTLVRVERRPREIEIGLAGVRLRGRALHNGVPLAHAGLVALSANDHSRSRMALVSQRKRPDGSATTKLYQTNPVRCEATTNEAGEFVCGPLLPGVTDVTWHIGEGSVTRRLDLAEGEEAFVELDFEGTDLQGVVTGPGGTTPPAGLVEALTADGLRLGQTTLRSDGTFLLSALPEQPLRVRVNAFADGTAEAASLLPSEAPSPLVLDLRRGPERELAIELRSERGYDLPRPELVLLDPTGGLVSGVMVYGARGDFRPQPQGEYWLAWAESAYGAGIRPLTLDSGSAAKQVQLAPAPGGSVGIECDALDYGGRLIRWLSVRTDPDGGDVTPFLSGVVPGLRFSEECRLALGRLGAGRYVLEIQAGGTTAERGFTVQEGDDLWLRFP